MIPIKDNISESIHNNFGYSQARSANLLDSLLEIIKSILETVSMSLSAASINPMHKIRLREDVGILQLERIQYLKRVVIFRSKGVEG